jgi:hypothetical protein
MTLVLDVLEALVSAGTIGLAVMTYFSVHEARRRELEDRIENKRMEHISYMLEQINDLYLPLLTEKYKIFDSRADLNNILKILATKYFLAEPETRKVTDTLFEEFNKMITPNLRTNNKFVDTINSLWPAVNRDYESLLKKLYMERGIKVPDNFSLPKIEDVQKP